MAKQVTYQWYDVHRYSDFLREDNFNEEQINFLIDQRNIYETAIREEDTEKCDKCGNESHVNHFDYDTYEREMWFTMNRSGLFEDDDENKTGITDWTPAETRTFITETNY